MRSYIERLGSAENGYIVNYVWAMEDHTWRFTIVRASDQKPFQDSGFRSLADARNTVCAR